MRVLFAGTPQVAVPSLRALVGSEHTVVGVLTRPPAPVGRKRVLTPSPVHIEAENLGIPVYTDGPNSPEILQILTEVDCVAVVAYGELIREPALSLPAHGWINLHFSLLPQWRGAAPVQYAIMAGQKETGMSVFQIEKGLDTGPVYATAPVSIGEEETSGDLLERLSTEGAPLLLDTLDALDAGEADAVAQTGEPTHAPTLRSQDGHVTFDAPAETIAARVRGLTPAPGAWATSQGQRYKLGPVVVSDADPIPAGTLMVHGTDVLVGTRTSPVLLTRLAPPGKSWMAAQDWARGLRDPHFSFEVTR